MLEKLHADKDKQLILGLLLGICFGFLLQRSGVTHYDVILSQLLLRDFTVVKVMLTAVVVGMVGVHALRSLGVVELHLKSGSIGSTVIGGLIFGVGFGLLGYCPGTAAAAAGQGSLDALFGGIVGIILGSWLFALAYPKLSRGILKMGDLGDITIPRLLGVDPWFIVVPVAGLIIGLLAWLESAGL